MTGRYQTLLVEIRDQILYVTLNRPEKRNALNDIMVKELNEVFTEFKDDNRISGSCLTGAGKVFCAGADLAYLQMLLSKSDEQNLNDSFQLRDMLLSIYRFPRPTLALVNGPAVAGGCGLMSVCDTAVAVDSSVLGYPEVKIGFVASIVSVFLVELVGMAMARYLLLTGELIPAAEAARMGLIYKSLNTDQFSQFPEVYFSNIKRNSPQAVVQTKQLFTTYLNKDLDKILEDVCRFNARSRKTEDFKEGILSFLDKRKPEWNLQ
ncbi:MAG: hypothetical protein E4H13_02505 [Calditrichales bacterium]|nr:MAG: hypothetical protein E4H13_02505 [Calditrichales bacterium]